MSVCDSCLDVHGVTGVAFTSSNTCSSTVSAGCLTGFRLDDLSVRPTSCFLMSSSLAGCSAFDTGVASLSLAFKVDCRLWLTAGVTISESVLSTHSVGDSSLESVLPSSDESARCCRLELSLWPLALRCLKQEEAGFLFEGERLNKRMMISTNSRIIAGPDYLTRVFCLSLPFWTVDQPADQLIAP